MEKKFVGHIVSWVQFWRKWNFKKIKFSFALICIILPWIWLFCMFWVTYHFMLGIQFFMCIVLCLPSCCVTAMMPRFWGEVIIACFLSRRLVREWHIMIKAPHHFSTPLPNLNQLPSTLWPPDRYPYTCKCGHVSCFMYALGYKYFEQHFGGIMWQHFTRQWKLPNYL